eukprot:674100_1
MHFITNTLQIARIYSLFQENSEHFTPKSARFHRNLRTLQQSNSGQKLSPLCEGTPLENRRGEIGAYSVVQRVDCTPFPARTTSEPAKRRKSPKTPTKPASPLL